MKNEEEFLSRYERTTADISLGNLISNAVAIKEKIGGAKLLAVVKANAYGHGAEKVADALSPYVDYFGVSDITEALSLRNSGIKKPILIFGRTPPEAVGILSDLYITQTVTDYEYANKLGLFCEKSGKRIKVHVKVDTGMSRLGVSCDRAEEEIVKIIGCKGLIVEGIYTHLSASDERSLFCSAYTKKQIDDFLALTGKLKIAGITFDLTHVSASGALADNLKEFNMVRAGLALYGCPPYGNYPLNLKEVMTLRSRIVSVKRLERGSCIGYGCTEVLEKDANVLVASIGYADGFPRSLSGKGRAFVRGKQLKVLGRVCMDMIMLDGGNETFAVGDKVEIFGFGTSVSINEFSACAGTVAYETLCRISPRVKRNYIV